VSSAERGYNGLPSADLVAAIDTALAAGGALTALHARAHAQQQARRPPTTRPARTDADTRCDPAGLPPDSPRVLPWGSMSDMDRRAFLANVGVFTGAGAASAAESGGAPLWTRLQVALDRSDAGLTTITERLETTVDAHWKLYESSPSHQLIADVLRQLETATTLLTRPHTADVLQRLRSVAGQIACQAAWLSFDLGATPASRQYYGVAVNAARQAGNPELQAQIVGRMSFIYLLDQPLDALHTLQAAQPLLGQAMSATRSWLAAIEAEAHAILGDETACFQAIDRSRDAISAGSPAPGAAFDEAQRKSFEGVCLILLDRADQAEQPLLDALAAVPPFSRHHANTLIHTAQMYAQQRQLDAACSYLSEAVNVVAHTRQAVGARKLQHARAQLGSDGAALLADVDDQLRLLASRGMAR
jgi:hypothetical protein